MKTEIKINEDFIWIEVSIIFVNKDQEFFTTKFDHPRFLYGHILDNTLETREIILEHICESDCEGSKILMREIISGGDPVDVWNKAELDWESPKLQKDRFKHLRND